MTPWLLSSVWAKNKSISWTSARSLINSQHRISSLCLVFSKNSRPSYQLSLCLHSYPKCLITLGSILCNISIFISPNTRIGHLQGHTILIEKTLERKEIKKWSPVISASVGENTLFTLVQWTTKNTCSFDIKKASNFISQDLFEYVDPF